MHVIGQSVLSNATVLHSKKYPKMKINNIPNMPAADANEAIVPLCLGSVISPTYDNIGASLNPILNPISTVDVYSETTECV